tara:strand:+ start:40 stop:483 length:444 start_codon:yes stop_codon:yes gene_type:complete
MGSVYKITNEDGREYYGSTIVSLKQRLSCHKAPSNHCATNTFNKDTMVIELVEEVEDIEQLKVREKFYIQNRPCVNKQLPFVNKEEQLAQHRKYSAKYYEHNKERAREASRKQNNKPYKCECGSVIKRGGLWLHLKSNKHINFMTPN